MHAYSLVHDDLPCMDDDDLRRGLPDRASSNGTRRRRCWPATRCRRWPSSWWPTRTPADAAIRLALIQGLARAAGAQGMVRGQAQDIAAETAAAPLTLAEITELQAEQDRRADRWSATAGAHLAGADPAPLAAYAAALGLAFQIADDILDVDRRSGQDRQAAAQGRSRRQGHLRLAAGARRRPRPRQSLVDAGRSRRWPPTAPRAEDLRQAARFAISRES